PGGAPCWRSCPLRVPGVPDSAPPPPHPRRRGAGGDASDGIDRLRGAAKTAGTPDAGCSPDRPLPDAPTLAAAPRSELFFQRLLEDLVAKHRLGIHPLQFSVLLLQRLEPLRVGNVHLTVFLAPAVQRRNRNLLLLAELLLAQTARFALAQQPDDL